THPPSPSPPAERGWRAVCADAASCSPSPSDRRSRWGEGAGVRASGSQVILVFPRPTARGQPMPTVTAGEQDIFYFEYRVSASRFPPVLLIHGAGGQHTHWPPQVRRLPGTRTFAPDLPGHGRSPGEGRSSIAAYAADMLALMDALEQ